MKYFLFFLIAHITITASATEKYKIDNNEDGIENFIEKITKKYFYEKIKNEKYDSTKKNNKIEQEFSLLGQKEEINDFDRVKKIQENVWEKIIKNFTKSLENINKKNKTTYDQTKGYEFGNFENNFSIEANVGIMFVSDTHADAESLKRIWFLFDKLKQAGEVDKIVFLGDYGDRGEYWVYTYFLLAAMADYYSQGENNDIIFIRGNHEWSHKTEEYLIEKAAAESENMINKDNIKTLTSCWEQMFLTGTIKFIPQFENEIKEKIIFCSHGTMPLNKNGKWEKNNEEGMFLANWNDFSPLPSKKEIEYSGRGGIFFTIPFYKIYEIMNNENIDVSIHGHCHQNQQLSFPNGKKIISVFSNDWYYYSKRWKYLSSVYVISKQYPCGSFLKISPQENERLKVEKSEKIGYTIDRKENYIEFTYKEMIFKTIPKEEKRKEQEKDNKKATPNLSNLINQDSKNKKEEIINETVQICQECCPDCC